MSVLSWSIIGAVVALVVYKDKLFNVHPDGRVTVKDEIVAKVPNDFKQYIPANVSLDAIVTAIGKKFGA